jgi:predicted small metal-binding protein
MTKHGKKYILGGAKSYRICPHCDYSTKGSIKEVDTRLNLHMKYKHGIDINTIDRLYIGVKKVEDIYSKKTADEAVFMANLLKMLK